MIYKVRFYDYMDGTTSSIDTIEAEVGYTAEEYIEDCKQNADEAWNEMLKHGEVSLIETPISLGEEIVNYIGTIWDFIQGKNEAEIREVIEEDMTLMDDKQKLSIAKHMDKIVQEAVAEIEG